MRISDWSSDVCSSDLLVDEKVEHARSLLELVANRHRVLVLLRAEAIGFVEDQAEHVGITFDALLVERTHNAGEQHIAARARGDGLPHLREKGRHEVDRKSTRLNSSH